MRPCYELHIPRIAGALTGRVDVLTPRASLRFPRLADGDAVRSAVCMFGSHPLSSPSGAAITPRRPARRALPTTFAQTEDPSNVLASVPATRRPLPRHLLNSIMSCCRRFCLRSRGCTRAHYFCGHDLVISIFFSFPGPFFLFISLFRSFG